MPENNKSDAVSPPPADQPASAPENTAPAKPVKHARSAKPAKEAKPAKGEKVPRRAARKVRRRWPAVLAGSATLVLAVGVVGAGSVFSGTGAARVVDTVPHPLPIGEALANCQGPTQLLAGSAAGTDPQFSANSSSTRTQLSAVALSSATGDLPGAGVAGLDGNFTSLFTLSEAPATPAPSPTELTGKPKMRAAVERGKDVGAPSVLRVQPLGGEVLPAAGAVVVDSGDGDLAGLAAATCQTPSNELWLSGASTSVGRTAVLMVSNSSSSPATVSLELFGTAGMVQAAAGKGIVVAPGTVRSVVLAGLAPDQESLSVHLKSTGGAVGAVIQQSVLRGLTPGGVDYLAPVQMPGSTMVVPGVRVQSPDASAKISGQSGYADAATTLAVTVPGLTDAVVEVKAFGPSGQASLPNGGVFTAKAGSVSQLALTGLPEGSYTLAVKADAAVTASVRLIGSTKPGDAVDLALAPSAGRLGDTHLVTLPDGVSSSLVFGATEGTATVTLTPISADGVLGTAKTVELKAGRTQTVDPAGFLGKDTDAVLVSATGSPAYGTQLLSKDGAAGIAVLPISGTAAGSHSINITTGY